MLVGVLELELALEECTVQVLVEVLGQDLALAPELVLVVRGLGLVVVLGHWLVQQLLFELRRLSVLFQWWLLVLDHLLPPVLYLHLLL